MEIYLGETGLDKTFQEDFPKSVKCHKCKSNCRVMFVGQEWDSKEYVCNLHENNGDGKKGKYWPHDAVAVACYLCEKCFEPNALINQA